MSSIPEVALDDLKETQGEIVRARRMLLPVAGILALVHLLTVHPYLETSRNMLEVETEIEVNAGLLAQLEPEIAQLRQAGDNAASQLDFLLTDMTSEMVDRFAQLRRFVQAALRGESPEMYQPPDPMMAMPMQQMQMPMQMQMPDQMQQMQMPSNLPPSPMQAPLPDQMQQMGLPPMQPATPNAPGIPDPHPPMGAFGPMLESPELRAILEEFAAGEPDYERLIAFARREIVETTYQRAQRDWADRIRPAYLDALALAAASARRLAQEAPESATEIARALVAGAEEMTAQKAELEAIVISHDRVVDEALGTDWWHTVEGKGAYADAVGQSVAEQLHAIAAKAEAPSDTLRRTLALQEELRDGLERQQEALERQFDEQRKQLAGLSGVSSVVPVDLASFIGLFPLVLGLVLGFMLWRVADGRRRAALSAAELRRVEPDEPAARTWLVRRALGGDRAGTPAAVTAILACGALIWIVAAVWEVAGSPIEPPLAPWTSGGLAVLMVLIAAGWDVAAIRRLAAQR